METRILDSIVRIAILFNLSRLISDPKYGFIRFKHDN